MGVQNGPASEIKLGILVAHSLLAFGILSLSIRSPGANAPAANSRSVL